jgi:hypothetical protein
VHTICGLPSSTVAPVCHNMSVEQAGWSSVRLDSIRNAVLVCTLSVNRSYSDTILVLWFQSKYGLATTYTYEPYGASQNPGLQARVMAPSYQTSPNFSPDNKASAETRLGDNNGCAGLIHRRPRMARKVWHWVPMRQMTFSSGDWCCPLKRIELGLANESRGVGMF